MKNANISGEERKADLPMVGHDQDPRASVGMGCAVRKGPRQADRHEQRPGVQAELEAG